MDDDFTERSDAFLSWFKTRNTNLSPKVRLADLRPQHAGRGIIAVADIEEDEELFSVGRQDILSVENSSFIQQEPGRQLVAGTEDPWLSLILVMIYEFLRGEQSPWKAYFHILPSTFDTLMFWSDEELEQLQASAVRQKIGKAGADELFREQVIKPIRASRGLYPTADSLSDNDILALAHHMGSTIMAYAFDIEKEPSQQAQDEEGYVSDEEDDLLPKGMIPMADMLNANADMNNARLFYGESMVSMKALKPIKAGEEIFNDYGPLPRADLLRRYGYITPAYTQYDVVEISTELVISVLTRLAESEGNVMGSLAPRMDQNTIDAKLEWLEKHGMCEDGFDISWSLKEDGFLPGGLSSLLGVLSLTEATFKKLQQGSALDALASPAAVLGSFLAVLEARLSGYESCGTTADQDRQLIAHLLPYPENRTDTRHLMALHVRLGEKELLIAARNTTARIAPGVISNWKKRPAPSDTDNTDERKHRKLV